MEESKEEVEEAEEEEEVFEAFKDLPQYPEGSELKNNQLITKSNPDRILEAFENVLNTQAVS